VSTGLPKETSVFETRTIEDIYDEVRDVYHGDRHRDDRTPAQDLRHQPAQSWGCGGLGGSRLVEVSALADGGGIQPLRVESLPLGIAATLRARIDQQEMVVEAAVHRDRAVALQALLAAPLLDSVANRQATLDELLEAHVHHLPTFS
jgi:hypothetical protein